MSLKGCRFLSVCLVVAGTLVFSGQLDAKPVSGSTGGETLFLSLKDAVDSTLKNNVSIAVEQYNSQINTQSITEEKAEFDPTIELELSWNEEVGLAPVMCFPVGGTIHL